LERGEAPKYWRPVANETQRRAGWLAHDNAFAAWREVARTVAASPAAADRAMAIGIVEFVRAMPVQRDVVVPDIRRNPAPERERRTASERDSQPDGPDPDIER